MNIINSCIGLSEADLSTYFLLSDTLGYQTVEGFTAFISEFHYSVNSTIFEDAKSLTTSGTFYFDLVYENNIKPRVIVLCKIQDNSLNSFYWY